jgi:hypothetical protein
MSQFKTLINLPINDLIARLPKGHHIDPQSGIRLSDDKQSVVVEWSHDAIKTPFSRALEITIAQIEGTESLPDRVDPGVGFQRVPNVPVAPKRARGAKVEQ